jgi:hypothetical protein
MTISTQLVAPPLLDDGHQSRQTVHTTKAVSKTHGGSSVANVENQFPKTAEHKHPHIHSFFPSTPSQQPQPVNDHEANEGDKSPVKINPLPRVKLLIGIILRACFHARSLSVAHSARKA